MIKNIPTLCVVCALLAPAAYAQSTCETRVDRNLDKSTQQKVEYCLTPEPEKAPNEPRVVYFSSYYVSSPKPKDKVKIPRYISSPAKNIKKNPFPEIGDIGKPLCIRYLKTTRCPPRMSAT